MEVFSLKAFALLAAYMLVFGAIFLPCYASEKISGLARVVTVISAMVSVTVLPEFWFFEKQSLYAGSRIFCIFFAILTFVLMGKWMVMRREKMLTINYFASAVLGIFAVVLVAALFSNKNAAQILAALYLIPVVLSFILAEVLRRILARRSKLALWWANGISLLVLEAAAAIWLAAEPYYLLVVFCLLQGQLLALCYGGYEDAKKAVAVAAAEK